MRQKRLYILWTALFAVLLAGCNSIQQVLKNNDPMQMYQLGIKYYNQQKWNKASMLFDAASPYFNASDKEDSLAFMNAHCKFKQRDYGAAASALEDFRRKFGRSVFIEDAEGILALSYFYLSPGPKRDQSMTTQALVAVNEFLSHYPDSEQAEKFRSINRELTERLHDKAYLNAYTYYKIGRYKAAIIALKNAVKLYPESRHREEIMYLIVKASSKLAENSVRDKQTDRYLSMLDSYYSFVAEFPESEYLREVERLAQHAKNYLERNKKNEENTKNNK